MASQLSLRLVSLLLFVCVCICFVVVFYLDSICSNYDME